MALYPELKSAAERKVGAVGTEPIWSVTRNSKNVWRENQIDMGRVSRLDCVDHRSQAFFHCRFVLGGGVSIRVNKERARIMKTSASRIGGLLLGLSTIAAWPATYTDTFVPNLSMIANHVNT